MKYYLWILPSPPHFECLEAQISALSSIYRSPPFAPHITIGSREQPYVFHPFDAPRLTLLPAQTQTHEKRALYYPVAPSPNLLKIQRYYAPERQDYSPHLSLIYGHFSTARRKDWQEKCPAYNEPILFGNLCLVKGGLEVRKWKILKVWPLRENEHTD